LWEDYVVVVVVVVMVVVVVVVIVILNETVTARGAAYSLSQRYKKL
jgi:preprotein translocase subunit SecG